MSINFEEIDFCSTSIGDLLLRRRRMIQLGDLDIYEVKLGEEFLMSSLFHEAEDQLAHLGLAALDRDELDVVVGGLGLGYTAVAALQNKRLSSLKVIEYLDAVIGWHKKGLVPMGKTLNEDARCELVSADFFDLKNSLKMHDAILLDIDHRPDFVLNSTNKKLYTHEGLSELSTHLNAGGVFAMWADGKPQSSFTDLLDEVFQTSTAHTVEFKNPVQGGTSFGAVYVAKKGKA
jgi:spermidine synthase